MNSRSNAITKLLRQAKAAADDTDAISTIAEFQHASRKEVDLHTRRSMLLVATGILEHSLAEAIGSKLVASDDMFRKKLFDGDHEREGIIGTIYTRNVMARALDIYGEKTFQDVNTVRMIRNLYAHPRSNADFSPETLAELCKFHGLDLVATTFGGDIEQAYKRHYADKPALYVLMSFIVLLVPYLLLHKEKDWDPVNRDDWRNHFS